MGEIFKTVLSRIGDSKTYVLLIIVTVIALAACVIASIFNHDVWGRFFDLLMGNSVVGGARAVVNDGLPKVAAAWQNPNSQAANPPSAMLEVIPPAALAPEAQAAAAPQATMSIPRVPGVIPNEPSGRNE